VSKEDVRNGTEHDGMQKLIQERDQALEELNHLRESMRSEVDIDPEEGDTEIYEREKNAVLIAVLERKLKDINAAIHSMEKGEYGICERCDNPIEAGRLEVKPDATLCLNCQREVERLSRRRMTR